MAELKAGLKATQGKSDLVRLKEEIAALLASPEAGGLSQADRDNLEDLLAKLLAKE